GGGGGGGGGVTALLMVTSTWPAVVLPRLSYAIAFRTWPPLPNCVVLTTQFHGAAAATLRATASRKNSTLSAPPAATSQTAPLRLPDTVAPASGALNATGPAWAASGTAALAASATKRIFICITSLLAPAGLLNTLERGRCNGSGARATHDAIVNHRARQPERSVIVRQLQVARDSAVERRAVVGQHLFAVEPR